MNRKSHCGFMYAILFFLIGLLVFAVYMTIETQNQYEEEVAAATEAYEYAEIQAMVDCCIPAAAPHSEGESETMICVPYNVDEMLGINEDFKGWLWIPDTDINYPVVQTDNNDTYLKKSFSGEYSAYGTLFLDAGSLYGSKNRVIHGHNMGTNRTEMFSSLVQYQNAEWAAAHKTVYFTEPDALQDPAYELFAVLNFDVNHLDEFNYFQADFDQEEDYIDYIDYLKDQSLYVTDFYPDRDILILSTCNRYYGYDNRLLVCFGRI